MIWTLSWPELQTEFYVCMYSEQCACIYCICAYMYMYMYSKVHRYTT